MAVADVEHMSTEDVRALDVALQDVRHPERNRGASGEAVPADGPHEAGHGTRTRCASPGGTTPARGSTVLAHGEPAVYCLPGRAPPIVVTTGARAHIGAVVTW